MGSCSAGTRLSFMPSPKGRFPRCDEPAGAESGVRGIGSSKRGGGCCGPDDDDDDEVYRNAHKDLGLGLFEIDFCGKKVHALHQTIGEVVGSECGATMMKTLVLIAEDIQHITKFCDDLISE